MKRISSSNKSGPFVGSEFAYEDISSQEVEEYTYKFLREEELDGQPTFVIERYPVDPKSGYTRQVVWLDHRRVPGCWKVDFYDRKDALLKTLTQTGYQQYLDRYWRPDRMEMVNHQTGKSTTLEWSDYVFQSGLEERRLRPREPCPRPGEPSRGDPVEESTMRRWLALGLIAPSRLPGERRRRARRVIGAASSPLKSEPSANAPLFPEQEDGVGGSLS